MIQKLKKGSLQLEQAEREVALKTNQTKVKFMTKLKKEGKFAYGNGIHIRNDCFERIDRFRYSGSTIQENDTFHMT